MKKGKIIGIIVGAIVLVLLIAGGIGYFFINDVAQKAKIVCISWNESLAGIRLEIFRLC